MTIRDYIYLAAILCIVSFGIYLRAHLINEGEYKVKAAVTAASQKQQLKDVQVAQSAIGDLNAEIQRLRSSPVTPPVVRVYHAACPLLAGHPATSTPDATPTGGSVPEVSAGTGGGPDLGPSLQRLALAADLLSAQERALQEWARKQ